MSKREVKYYFGRLNLMAQYETDKEEFIINGLTKGVEINIRDYKWGFYDIEKIKSDIGIFISGYLVKYNPKRDEEVVNSDMHKLTLEEIRDSVKAKSRFLLHAKSGVIAFHPIANQIEIEQFINNYVEIFMKAYDNFFVNAEIQIISDRFKILEVLKDFSKIYKINIILHPSNPSLSEDWKEIDKRMKELDISKYQEQYDVKQDKSGDNLRNDKNMRAKLTMAEDGYGKGEVTGELNDEIKTISTKDNPVIDFAPGDNSESSSVLDSLMITILNIFKRFESNKNEENS